ncbi:MAG: DUF1232 domain-containing protein, partial [Chloroflexi bacterium]|nr:DUF1232 domain-containing protein [Chloroflexota bacterium]
MIPFAGQLLRVSWLLFWDRRVSLFLKILPLAAVIYVLSPIDFLRDYKLGIGQVDDVIVTGILLTLFVIFSPKEIVSQHTRGKSWVKGNDDGSPPVEGSYR